MGPNRIEMLSCLFGVLYLIFLRSLQGLSQNTGRLLCEFVYTNSEKQPLGKRQVRGPILRVLALNLALLRV